MSNKEKKGLGIGVGSFISAIGILMALMIMTYILTLVIPGKGIPFWKWLLSPFLVLGSGQGVRKKSRCTRNFILVQALSRR